MSHILTNNTLIFVVNAADSANGGGTWDSTHVIQVNPVTKKSSSYKLTSTIMLQITAPTTGSGPMTDLSGSLTRQVTLLYSLGISHTPSLAYRLNKIAQQIPRNLI